MLEVGDGDDDHDKQNTRKGQTQFTGGRFIAQNNLSLVHFTVAD